MAVRSLLTLQAHLIDKGHEVTFDIVANGSRLPNVRNGIVNRFIESSAEKLLFIDADMVYEPGDIEKLLESPHGVAVINYRKKTAEVIWNAETAMEDGQPIGVKIEETYWLKTYRAGTGLMCISRDAMLAVKRHYKHPFYYEVINGDDVGEDYVFCKRLGDVNCDIFILADAYAAHIGDTYYAGNYHEYLKGESNATS